MPLSRWLVLIGVLVGLGCMQVASRNALFLRGLGAGEQMVRIHDTQADISRLEDRVVGLASPSRLARVAEERQLTLVAWSPLPQGPMVVRVMPLISKSESSVVVAYETTP